MWETAVPIGQWMTILVMALALGSDAFSLCIGIGMRGVRRMDAFRISIVIAFFHVLMPLMGVITGVYIGIVLGKMTAMAAGALLVILGGHMIYSSFKGESSHFIDTASLWGTIWFALSVSVDSFSVGVTLGMFRSDLLITIVAFGLFGGAMSIVGLLLGHHAGQYIGEYGEAVGGAILLVFGILFLIPS
ncbi:manganese efflux pump MntP [Paenibacillus apiarius]|uniref:Putative manganese efflux pump MntP n=1 Tax=Paenibacillus apiarius TaxID=46240 RepID=A0ABT4DSN7_9BACL|nr:manganese efflux pump MntP family protein [Paenibacillus apiarius]MBN3523941.1 manganese efflux pump [Paenibacillus apiarius]MCY9514254.1 manganese efflux pump MntP family protein [Paenibacillus apiarius]MCY9520377.1 manganese efflux pump MntP family protein [Paenibacillus apiarius]MCY9554726.1 manganese efflux pump MntP family protein [Paenibacillus apiarius]MCY9557343.1 manganese efflux pump MntP family protein [Paenibacillus apiarius]